MDGLRGVWHGGPFARDAAATCSTRSQILFGTDPVAIDRLLLDIIDDKRKAEGAISIWDRAPKYLRIGRQPRARRRPERQHHHPRARPRRVRRVARPRRRGPREDQRRRTSRYDASLLLLAALPCVYWTQGADRRPALKAAGIDADLRAARPGRGVEAAGVDRDRRSSAAELTAREALPVPGIRGARRIASRRPAAPWVNANGWRLPRDRPASRLRRARRHGGARRRRSLRLRRRRRAARSIPPTSPPRRRCCLPAQLPASDLPDVADFAVVDDGSAETGEVMNLLARRNLLFQPVAPRLAAFR